MSRLSHDFAQAAHAAQFARQARPGARPGLIRWAIGSFLAGISAGALVSLLLLAR